MGAVSYNELVVVKGNASDAFRQAVEEANDYNGHKRVIVETFKPQMVLGCQKITQGMARRNSMLGKIHYMRIWKKETVSV